DSELLLCHGMVCVVGRMRDLILQLSKSSIYSTKPNRLIKFLCVCFICYVANIIVIKIFFVFMPEKIYSAQILGMFTYTITGFILNKFWAMK
ncbi:GtrA family protein, partial [Klebsiella pneumoniae]